MRLTNYPKRLLFAGNVLTTLVGLATASRADDFHPGDRIVVVRDVQLRVPTGVTDRVWPGLVLTVTAVEDRWLWVSHGHAGWLDSADAIPLNAAAADRLTEMLSATPQDARIYLGRADVWKALGNLDRALADLNEAIRISPKASGYVANRGDIYALKGNLEQAMKDYAEALRINPRDKYAFTKRGNAYSHRGEYDLAIEEFDRALEIDPRFEPALADRGWARHRKGDYQQALVDYVETIKLNPQFAVVYNNIGWLRATCPNAEFRDGMIAVQAAKTACELSGWKDPNQLDTLAAAYAEAGDFANAIQWVTKARDLAPAGQRAEFDETLKLYRAGTPLRDGGN